MPTTEERLAALETLVAELSASQTAETPSTYCSTIDNNVWPPADYPQGWEIVQEEST